MAARRGLSIICSLVPPSPLPPTLPFCHVCRGTYRVAAGFLFSGNVLDDWKATWSDLRDTTCKRFIISFPLFFNSLFLLWGCHPEVRGEHKRKKGFRRIVVTGLSLCFPLLSCSGLIANTGGVLLRVLVFWSGGMPAEVTLREAVWNLLRGVGGVNGFGSALIWEILSEFMMS